MAALCAWGVRTVLSLRYENGMAFWGRPSRAGPSSRRFASASLPGPAGPGPLPRAPLGPLRAPVRAASTSGSPGPRGPEPTSSRCTGPGGPGRWLLRLPAPRAPAGPSRRLRAARAHGGSGAGFLVYRLAGPLRARAGASAPYGPRWARARAPRRHREGREGTQPAVRRHGLSLPGTSQGGHGGTLSPPSFRPCVGGPATHANGCQPSSAKQVPPNEVFAGGSLCHVTSKQRLT